MKTFKFILLTLLLMCGLMAHAQKVVVYKTDGTKVEYNVSDVKDVKYKKAEVVYYFYVGTTLPTAETLATLSTDAGTVLTSKPTDWTSDNKHKITLPKGTAYVAIPVDWNATMYDENGFWLSWKEETFITVNGIEYSIGTLGKKLTAIDIYAVLQ